MGNQNSAHSSSASVTIFPHSKSNILTIKPVSRAMKSDLSINKSSRIASYSEKEMIEDLEAMQKINDLRRDKLNLSGPPNKVIGIPTVFRWHGKGNEIFIAGSFNNWEEKIPLKKSDKVYYTIINCQPGHHSYKFFVNGVWMHDESQQTEDNPFGTLNNWIEVTEEDLDLDFALNYDEEHSKKSAEGDYNENPNGEYGQDIPRRPNPVSGMTINSLQPRTLPPYLSETVLNVEVARHHDPALLTTPYHVQVNHMYASSISSGIAALSVTVRYRNKYITTLFYKPISD